MVRQEFFSRLLIYESNAPERLHTNRDGAFLFIMCVKYIVDIFQEIITWCHGGITPIKYGALYNWYAATDVRGICASGWHLPTNLDYNTI